MPSCLSLSLLHIELSSCLEPCGLLGLSQCCSSCEIFIDPAVSSLKQATQGHNGKGTKVQFQSLCVSQNQPWCSAQGKVLWRILLAHQVYQHYCFQMVLLKVAMLNFRQLFLHLFSLQIYFRKKFYLYKWKTPQK